MVRPNLHLRRGGVLIACALSENLRDLFDGGHDVWRNVRGGVFYCCCAVGLLVARCKLERKNYLVMAFATPASLALLGGGLGSLFGEIALKIGEAHSVGGVSWVFVYS